MRTMTSAVERLAAAVLAALLAALSPARAEIGVTDDLGRRVVLARPAQRIVSLAPHATELLFAAGAGDKVVAAVDYSDYPPPARRLPRIGSFASIDLERLLALRPDLVVAWQSGNGAGTIERLERLGLTVYVTESHRLEQIAADIERLGELAGTGPAAARAAEAFRAKLAALAARYSGQRPVRVFYQVWNQPLTTVNGEQIISQVLSLCGGRNVFAELPALAPTVDVEAVLAADPEAIIASGMDLSRPEWLDDWRRWPQLQAVRRGNLLFVPPDLLQRHSPRILDGAESVCRQLERVRAKDAP